MKASVVLLLVAIVAFAGALRNHAIPSAIAADVAELYSRSADRQSSSGACGDGTDPSPQSLPSGDCDWYDKNTCCDVFEAELIVGAIQSFIPSGSCQDALIFVTCAACSPDVGEWITVDPVSNDTYEEDIGVCSNMCEKIYNACKNTKINGTSITGGLSESEYVAECASPSPCFSTGEIVVPGFFVVALGFLFLVLNS